jgi:ACS family sodium-dependent inorganic phosphate cotransporter/ACS family sodium-dependent inorganic phosphate cotransporter-like MFS transporter 9
LQAAVLSHAAAHAVQVKRGVPVLRVRKGIQTAAFLGPVLALGVLSSPAVAPPLALLCMTAALGITSLGAHAAAALQHVVGRSALFVVVMPLQGRPERPSISMLCSSDAFTAPSRRHVAGAGQAGFVANMSDIAPRHAGILFGLCNTFGSLAGILGVSGGCCRACLPGLARLPLGSV